MTEYKDLEGRKYNSLPKLCRDNDLDYNKCYRLFHNKGLSLEDAIKQSKINISIPNEKVKTDPKLSSVFYPTSTYPGREYVKYLEFMREKYSNNAETQVGMAAHNSIKKAKMYDEVLDSIEQFWLGVMDACVCHDDQMLRTLSDKNIETARAYLNNPKGLYKEIYEDFSKEHKLGKYSAA